jgi:hypothetical protein
MYQVHAMEDMEYDDEDKLDMEQPIPMLEKPEYPPYLKICLTHRELRKLELDPSEAEVGGTVHLFAIGCITNVNHSDGANGYNCRVEIQLEKISIHSEDMENEEVEENEEEEEGEDGY